jgi:hypothetical protein
VENAGDVAELPVLKLNTDLKIEFEDWIFEQTAGIVQSGPFKGMKMLREKVWADGALSPMLLGCHEKELWREIEAEISRLKVMASPVVLNVGCAEGYYAVGLKRRLPVAMVIVVDSNCEAILATKKLMAANDVLVEPAYTFEAALKVATPDLIVMDCEGAEVDYLDPVRFPGVFDKTTVIVELHQSADQDTGNILLGRFSQTHFVFLIWEGGRDPNDYPLLREQPSLTRWLAVCEDRCMQMAWFLIRPRQ